MKTIILLEMAILAGGIILQPRSSGQTWQQILTHTALPRLIAVVILTVLLLSGDEVGLGGASALFGGLVALSYLLAALHPVERPGED